MKIDQVNKHRDDCIVLWGSHVQV